MNLFMFFKILSWLILPPSIFIIFLISSIFFIKKGKKLFSIFLISTVIVSLYLMSIEPVRDMILIPLEDKYPFPNTNKLKCDVFVTLGGGMHLYSPEDKNNVTLNPSSTKRLITTYKIWKKHKRKIILTGGRPLNNKKYPSEAEVMSDFLKSLGVNKKYLILESSSLNTFQNAKLTKEILQENHWKKPCLITSAYHMPRAVKVFKHIGLNVIPVPSDYRTNRIKYTWEYYIPRADVFSESYAGIHEYIGILFYKIRYGI